MSIFVAVIGNKNSGKSTIIRSLTGCRSGAFRGWVEDKLTGQNIYVICSSPQELYLPSQELGRIFKQVLAKSNCNGICIAIQPTRPRARLSLEDIVKEAKSLGFDIYAYTISPGHINTSVDHKDIAKRLKPLGVQPHIIDGRRFAYINARKISKQTRLVD